MGYLQLLAIPGLLALITSQGSPVVPPAADQGMAYLLPKLEAVSASTGIPLGVLYGWILHESGGRIGGNSKKPCPSGCGQDTAHCCKGMDCCASAPYSVDCSSCGERGLGQIAPEEWAELGQSMATFPRLSEDVDFSIYGLVIDAKRYKGMIDALAVAPPDSELAWRLVKLCHTLGSGTAIHLINQAVAAGHFAGWADFENYSELNDFSLVEWFNHVDDVFTAGAPYGVGYA